MKLDTRETATILAALRYWQRNIEQGNVGTDDEFEPIASNAGAVKPLTAEEIDAICERLNFDETADPCQSCPKAQELISHCINGGGCDAQRAYEIKMQGDEDGEQVGDVYGPFETGA